MSLTKYQTSASWYVTIWYWLHKDYRQYHVTKSNTLLSILLLSTIMHILTNWCHVNVDAVMQ